MLFDMNIPQRLVKTNNLCGMFFNVYQSVSGCCVLHSFGVVWFLIVLFLLCYLH